MSLLALAFYKAVEVMVPERYKRAIFRISLGLADIHEKDDHEDFQGHNRNDNSFAFFFPAIPSFRLFSISNSPCVCVQACQPKGVPGVWLKFDCGRASQNPVVRLLIDHVTFALKVVDAARNALVIVVLLFGQRVRARAGERFSAGSNATELKSRMHGRAGRRMKVPRYRYVDAMNSRSYDHLCFVFCSTGVR